jgi:hypothetical protein
MPIIDTQALQTKMTADQWELAAPCFAKSKGASRLRTSRPTKASGATQYVWRMVAFIVSTNPQHHCMPVGADFYIKDSEFAHRTDQYIPKLLTENCQQTVDNWSAKTWDMMHRGEQRRKYISEELEPIIEIIIDTIPKSQWRGAHRWHQAFYG